MKFIVYHSDYYYPYDEVFDSLPQAIAAFEKLKADRKDQMEYDIDPYFATDYLGIIVDEISKEKMKFEAAPFVPEIDEPNEIESKRETAEEYCNRKCGGTHARKFCFKNCEGFDKLFPNCRI